mmetsp:Transcript_29024/g.76117  ORF Transcript_29024/g.76117 Transcript_29024/m.76117 type:complete len:224 (+) Transcript_29024:297-968(+)
MSGGEPVLNRGRPLLLIAWHNPWPPRWLASGGPGHTQGMPREVGADGRRDFVAWLHDNGVSEEDVMDLGPAGITTMSEALGAWSDAALFVNRCEGGTNLIAMEALASGVPVILSANTGHMDLIATGCPLERTNIRPACVPLHRRRDLVGPGGPGPGINPYHQWGESDADEAAEELLRLWEGPAEAREIGVRGREMVISRFTWGHFRRLLVEMLRGQPGPCQNS